MPYWTLEPAWHLPSLPWLPWQPLLQCVSCFNNPSATGACSLFSAVNWIYVHVRRSPSTAPPVFSLPSQPHLPPHSSHPHPHTVDHFLSSHHDDSLADSLNGSPEYELETKPCSGQASHDLTPQFRSSRDLTPQFRAAETLSSTPSKADGPVRCIAMTHSGLQCRLRSLPGGVTCHKHS